MIDLETVVRQQEFRKSDGSTERFAVVLVIDDERGPSRLDALVGIVGLDGFACFRTGVFEGSGEHSGLSADDVDFAFEDALQARMESGWVAADAALVVPFKRGAMSADDADHIHVTLAPDVDAASAAAHLKPYLPLEAVARTQAALTALDPFKELPVHTRSALMPCLVRLARDKVIHLYRDGSLLALIEMNRQVQSSSGERRELCRALGLVDVEPRNWADSIGSATPSLVL